MATTKTAPKKKAAPKRAVRAKAAAPKAETAPKAVSMTEATMYSMAGKDAGTVALPAELFGVRWNADLVHQVMVGMQANARDSIAHTKDRGEVRGGGKKPWKQKGTGRARHGSSRSPIWRGGGITFGPRAERDFSVKLNKKMKRAALAAALSRKHKDGEVVFVDSLSFAAPKTKEAVAAMAAIAKGAKASRLMTKAKNAAIIALPQVSAEAKKSFRNIASFEVEEVRNLNVVDLLTHKYLVIVEPAKAFEVLAKAKAA
jgi:large subunit ribosomal protein L4